MKRKGTHEPNSPTIATVTGAAVLSVAHAGSCAANAIVRLVPVFVNLPKAVLGAIVIQTVVFGLMDIKAMKRISRLNRTEFWAGLIALLRVVSFGTLQEVK